VRVPTKDSPSGDGLPAKKVWAPLAESRVRRLLADTMKRSGKGYEQIAREMSEALGLSSDRPIDKGVLADCVRCRRKGRRVRFLAAWVPAFCEVTGSDELQRHLLSERLRGLLAAGESVEKGSDSLKRAVALVERLAEGTARSKR
jgi:hypothetical protein